MIEFLVIISFLLYPFDGFQVFSIAGYGVKFVDITLAILYVFFIFHLIFEKKRVELNNNVVFHFLLLVLFSAMLSGIYPLVKGDGLAIVQFIKTFIHFVFVYFFVFFSLLYDLKTDFWNKLIRILLIYSIFINIFGIYQVFARLYDLPLAWLPLNNVSMVYRGLYDISDISQLSIQFMNLYRATSIFTEPSHYAIFLTLILVFQLTPYLQKKEPFIKSRLLNIIITSLSFVSLLATFSLTALITLAMIYMGYLFFERREIFKNFVFITIGALIILIITDFIIKSYTETSPLQLFYTRVDGVVQTILGNDRQISGESFKYRTVIIETAFEIWQKSPIIGCGLGNFYLNQNKNINFAHDIIGNAISEMGFIGLTAILGLFISIFIYLIKLKNNESLQISKDEEKLIGVCLYLMIQITAVNFFSSSFLVYVNLWFYIGLIVSLMNSVLTKNYNNNIVLDFSSKNFDKNELLQKIKEFR